MEIRQEPRRSEITCRTATIDSFYYGSFHWHENYEICQVLKKNESFRVAGDLIEANAGDIVTIKDRTIHQFLISTEKTELRIFQFSTRILLNATSNPTPLKVHITREEIAEQMAPEKYTGRAPSQVVEFLEEEIAPML